MPCCQGQDYDRMFDAKSAAKELKSYVKKGPRGATARLLQTLRIHAELGPNASLLDIGGGVGVIQHELVRAGIAAVTAVDASQPYLQLLAAQAKSRGYADRQTLINGDFVDLSPSVSESTIVTLDKVICCYPNMRELVLSSTAKAQRWYAIVVPRDDALVRAIVRLGNWFMRRVLRYQFQSYAHRIADIDQLCAQQGLALVSADPGWFWNVRLYSRQ